MLPASKTTSDHDSAPPEQPSSEPSLLVSRVVRVEDLPAIEALHDAAFGPGALTRAAYRVREGQPRISPFCRALYSGSKIVAAIRFTHVRIGGHAGALTLGPLAVAPSFANQGHGRRILSESLDATRMAGIELILLVGDPPYYTRFGFVTAPRGRFYMPGPVDPGRLLALNFSSPPAGVLDPCGKFAGRVVGAA